MQGEDATHILDFACSFLLFDLFELDDAAGRDRLLRSLRDLLRSQFTSEEIDSWASGPGVHSWLRRVYDYDGPVEDFGYDAVYSLTRALYGRKALVMRHVRDALRGVASPLRARAKDVSPVDEGEDVDAVLARLTGELEARPAGE